MRPASLTLLLAALPALAAEHAVLVSGFRLRILRHEVQGGTVRLHTESGFIELPASQVASFEAEEYVPPPPPPAPPTPAAASAPVAEEPVDPRQLVEEAADRHGIHSSFLHAVARAESGYRPDAVSPKGAVGIMQLMPATASAYSADPLDPRQNVEAGTRYLADLLIRYKDYPDQLRRALAAYNAGPGAVERFGGVPPYPETRNYVRKVMGQYLKSLPSAGN